MMSRRQNLEPSIRKRPGTRLNLCHHDQPRMLVQENAERTVGGMIMQETHPQEGHAPLDTFALVGGIDIDFEHDCCDIDLIRVTSTLISNTIAVTLI